MATPSNLILCHFIPGRLRVKISAPPPCRSRFEAVQNRLRQPRISVSIDTRPETGSIIVSYDPQKHTRQEIVAFLENEISTLSKTAPEAEKEKLPARPSVFSSSPPPSQSRLFPKGLPGFLALTAFGLYLLIRRFLFRLPISLTLGSPAGIVALAAMLPLVRRSLQALSGRESAGLFPFLTGTCLLAIWRGEIATALEVLWVTRFGMLLEDYAVDRSRRAIRENLLKGPMQAYLWQDGEEREVPLGCLRAGDRVAVRMGERVPVDGQVAEGKALVDEAAITGRAEPEVRGAGDPVYAGTLVQQGRLIIDAEKTGEDTYLNRIMKQVEDSLANRAPVEKKADLLARRLVRLGFFATLATFLLTRNWSRAFSVLLVVACPCATVLAASTAVAAALANAARNRCLVKGGLYLEQFSRANCFAFDKTGTITAPAPQVATIIPRPAADPRKLLALAASAETHNPHPLGRAIVFKARSEKVPFSPPSSYDWFLGKGVRASVNGDTALVGNEAFMQESGVNCRYFRKKAEALKELGQTPVFVAKNGVLHGVLGLANQIRQQVPVTIEGLKNEGVQKFVLLSGDAEPVVRRVAENLGIEEFRAPLLPEEKARYIQSLKAEGREVVMVGDGINDALALSEATVGVALGAGGSEAAVEAADIALVDDRLDRLVFLRRLSRKSLRVVDQNHWLAMGTNCLGIFLGAVGWLPPLLAGVLHIVHTLGIMGNSSRLLAWQPETPPGETPAPAEEEGRAKQSFRPVSLRFRPREPRPC